MLASLQTESVLEATEPAEAADEALREEFGLGHLVLGESRQFRNSLISPNFLWSFCYGAPAISILNGVRDERFYFSLYFNLIWVFKPGLGICSF